MTESVTIMDSMTHGDVVSPESIYDTFLAPAMVDGKGTEKGLIGEGDNSTITASTSEIGASELFVADSPYFPLIRVVLGSTTPVSTRSSLTSTITKTPRPVLNLTAVVAVEASRLRCRYWSKITTQTPLPLPLPPPFLQPYGSLSTFHFLGYPYQSGHFLKPHLLELDLCVHLKEH